MLHISFKSTEGSVISYVVICWRRSIRASDLKKLNKLIKQADSVLELIVDRRILHNTKGITDSPVCPLHKTVILQCLQSEYQDLGLGPKIQEVWRQQGPTESLLLACRYKQNLSEESRMNRETAEQERWGNTGARITRR